MGMRNDEKIVPNTRNVRAVWISETGTKFRDEAETGEGVDAIACMER